MSETPEMFHDEPRVNEMFSFRDGEALTPYEEPPEEGLYFAAMLRSVEMPEGPREEVDTPGYKGPPAQFVAVTCEKRAGGWAWLPLTLPSKQSLGGLMHDSWKCEPDRWYYITLT